MMKQTYRIMALLLVMTAAVLQSKADNRLSLDPTTINVGTPQRLTISLTNDSEVTAFQFDIKLPAGIQLNTTLNEDEETVPDVQLTDRKKSSHQVSCSQQSDGRITVVVLSMRNQSLRGSEGAVITLGVTATATMTSGNYSVELTNIHLVPLTDGAPAERIDQPDFTSNIYVNNTSEGSEVDVRLMLQTETLIAAGANQTLAIALQNNIDITALQFDILLPAGMTIGTVTNEDGEQVPNVQLTARKKSSHQVSCSQHSDGTYTVVILSMRNQAFSGDDGELVEMGVSVSVNMAGSYDVQLKNIHLMPLVGGTPGIRIDQPDFTKTVYVNNQGGTGPTGPMSITVAPLSLMPGETDVLYIDMQNDRDVCSFQMNVRLPEGVSVVKEYNEDDEYVEAISLTNRKKSSHELNFKQTADGSYFLLAYSLSNATFKDNSGHIVSLKVKAGEDLMPGTYSVILSGVLMITPSEEKISQEDYSAPLVIGASEDIQTLSASDCVARSQWLNLQGQPATARDKGMLIRRDVMTDGTVHNTKIINQ